MQNYKKNFVTRTLAWVLAAVMVIAMVPVGVFAGDELEINDLETSPVGSVLEDYSDTSILEGDRPKQLPTWSKQQYLKDGLRDWKLPTGTKIVAVGVAGTGMTGTGVNYIGHFKNDQGRIVLKLRVNSSMPGTPTPFSKISFKFDAGLYEKIDWTKSYITGTYGLSKGLGTEVSTEFFGNSGFATSSTEKTVNLIRQASGYQIRDVYLILKDQVKDWSEFKGQNYLVQMRVFNDDGSRTWSRHSNVYKEPDARLNYNTYTLSTVISDKDNMNNGLVYGASAKGDPLVRFANTRSVYIPEKGIIRVLYQRTGRTSAGDDNYGKAFYQAFDSSFKSILKPDKDTNAIGRMYISDHAYNLYSDIATPFQFEDLNQGENNTDYLVVAAKDFKVPQINGVDAYKTIRAADLDYNTVIQNVTTVNPVNAVVEYNVDVDRIEKELKKGNKNVIAWAFASRYLHDGQQDGGNGKRQFVYKLNEALKIPKGSTIEVNYGFHGTTSLEKIGPSVRLGNNDAITFSPIISQYGYVGSSPINTSVIKYKVVEGITLDAGTEILMHSPYDFVTSNEVNLKITGPNTPNSILDVTVPVLRKGGQIEPLLKTRAIINSEAVSSGMVQKTPAPIVDEIFTTDDKVTGLINFADTILSSKYGLNHSKQQDLYVYDSEEDKKEVLIPDGFDDKSYAAKTGNRVINIYDSENSFTKNEYEGYEFEINPIKAQNKPFEKDEAVIMDSKMPARTVSSNVLEQVQEKIKFDLNGKVSKDNGLKFITKIAPLNAQYRYDLKTGALNPDYKPSGFLGHIETTVTNGEEIESKVDNLRKAFGVLADHNGQPLKGEELKLRKMPENKDIEINGLKKLIGWTTQKLEDVPGGKTAAEQFYELQDKKEIIRSEEDWNKQTNQIFDAYSPLHKNEERTVYAVYGGLSIVLHSANAKNGQKETIVRIPITQSDIDTTKDKLDGMTEASINKIINKTIVKEMPKAPYTEKAEDVAEADERLKDFVKKDSTFIGWTTLENQETLVVGRNNPRIGALIKGEVSDEEQNKVKVPKSTESLTNLMENANKATLPSGFNFGIAADDFVVDGNRLSTREEILEKINEIHLYAVYRPFYEVTVKPQYNVLNKELKDKNHKNGTLEELSAEKLENVKDETLKIGLLTRTAVTGYGKPTVDATANYNPIEVKYLSDGKILKEWSKTSNQELKWHLPGYDELGRRKSYISVVVPDGKDDKYTNFANKFTSQSWSNLNISTNMKADGTALDPDAPKNYFYDGDIYRDPYGASLAKTQSLTIGKDQEHLDVFTSATARKVLLSGKSSDREEDREVTGYDIVMVNSLETLPTPSFEPVRNTDKKVTLEWDKGTDSKPTKYDSIDKIEFYLPKTNEKGELLDEEGKVINENNQKPPAIEKTELKKDTAPGEFKSSDGNVKAVIDSTGKKLEVTGLDLTSKGGKDLKAKYFTTVAQKEVAGPEGTTKIIANKDSAPINEMRQGIKKDPRDNPTIKFTVPMKDLDQVGVDSKYIAEKWDSKANKWVKVGEKFLGADDKISGQYQGNEYEIPLENVVDGDKIRIVSMESNPDARYTQEEKAANPRLENNFSRPAYSTGDENSAPDANKPGSKFVELDLKAPHSDTNDPIKAADEKFRRYINIKGSLDELPDNQKVVLEINYSGKGQKQQGNFVKEFDTKEKLVEYLYEIPRIEDMPDMWIYAKDKFGNMEHTDTPSKSDGIKIEYEKTYQCKVFVMDATQRKKYINVTSDKDNAKVTAVVYSGNQELARGEATVTTANGYVRLALKVTGGAAYRLKKGDRIHITCEAPGTENGKNITYTTNPFDIFVR